MWAEVRFVTGKTFRVRGKQVGPFVVHRTVRKHDDAHRPPWCVTHIKSGYRCGVFEKRQRALNVAKRLARVRGADWSVVLAPLDTHLWPPGARARCSRIIGAKARQ